MKTTFLNNQINAELAEAEQIIPIVIGTKNNSMKNNYWFNSFLFAARGLKHIIKQESNFRLEMALGVLALIAAAVLKCSATEWAIILICCTLVFITEAINSVFEELVDWIHPEHHEKAGKIKDMAAAAPLIASLFALITGLFIFIPKIWVIIQAFLK
ncbi:MAG: diacylglycerol kinase family protein [Bacteroidia bacterium]|nr:diacylglycerol kinase family protein [Bacteroidia bacterium]